MKIILTFIALAALMTAPLAGQTKPRSFSADQVRTMGKRTTTGKIYVSGNAARVEREQTGRQLVSILLFDRKVMWVLMPAQKMYTETDNVTTDPSQFGTSDGFKTERQLLGNEQVGPYQCDKYRVQSTLDGREYVSFEWDAKELGGLAVKMQGEKGDWTTEYQNIHLGPQDPSLFEIPAGYQKMSMGGMLKP